MIRVTHLNNREFFLNSDLILYIERTPDTLIVMTTGAKIMVKENAEEVVELVTVFRRKLFAGEAQLNVIRHELPAPNEE